MEEIEQRFLYKPKTRTLIVFLEGDTIKPYKIRFEKKDKANTERVVISCNAEKYIKDYIFKPNTPYSMEINSGFVGNIILEINNREFKYKILTPSDTTYAISTLSSKTKLLSEQNNISTDSLKKQIMEKDLSKHYLNIEIGNTFFSKEKDGEHTFSDDNKLETENFFKNSTVQAVITGLFADTLQVSYDTSKISNLLKDIKGLSYYIKTTNGKRYIIFKGYAGLRNVLTGTRYLTTSATVKPLLDALNTNISFKTVSNGVGITVIVASAIEIGTYFLKEEDEKDFTDLVVSILTGVTKAAIAFIFTTLIIGLFFSSATVFVVITATIIIGVVASMILNGLDSELDISKRLQVYVNEYEEKVKIAIENKKKEVLNNISTIINDKIDDTIEYAKRQAIKKIEDIFNELFNRHFKVN